MTVTENRKQYVNLSKEWIEYWNAPIEKKDAEKVIKRLLAEEKKKKKYS